MKTNNVSWFRRFLHKHKSQLTPEALRITVNTLRKFRRLERKFNKFNKAKHRGAVTI